MDFSESTKVVYNRIHKLEPDHVSKIIGYLLLQDNGENDMIRLAFSPDNVIQLLINKVKARLGLCKPALMLPVPPMVNIPPVADVPLQFSPYSGSPSVGLPSPPTLRVANPYWDPQASGDQQAAHVVDYMLGVYSDMVADDFCLQQQMRYLGLEDQFDPASSVGSELSGGFHYPTPAFPVKASRRSPSLPEFPVKICHYFNKGFCKHGSNCRYFHSYAMPEGLSQHSKNEMVNEDHLVSQSSLERLELELTELLRSRGGVPVSIASLPMMYYEKYGRTLQAEGYLTESQRHGKAGFSLSKLLSRLKNSIRLIDRPHGQHSVILAEDVQKYLEHANERNDPAGTSGSRQIYLTFPAESTFTEPDVSNYFNKFGPVEDVRIPCQQKRMFGFVTFAFTETAKQVLAKGNPHFICGARVLVKPYKEKSRLVDRKHADKMHNPTCYGQHLTEGDSDIQSSARCNDDLRSHRKEYLDEHEHALGHERRRIGELHIGPRFLGRPSYVGHSMDQPKRSEVHEEQSELPPADGFDYFFDVVNNGSSGKDPVTNLSTSCSEYDSQGINLPESPFAYAIGSGISTAT